VQHVGEIAVDMMERTFFLGRSNEPIREFGRGARSGRLPSMCVCVNRWRYRDWSGCSLDLPHVSTARYGSVSRTSLRLVEPECGCTRLSSLTRLHCTSYTVSTSNLAAMHCSQS